MVILEVISSFAFSILGISIVLSSDSSSVILDDALVCFFVNDFFVFAFPFVLEVISSFTLSILGIYIVLSSDSSSVILDDALVCFFMNDFFVFVFPSSERAYLSAFLPTVLNKPF